MRWGGLTKVTQRCSQTVRNLQQLQLQQGDMGHTYPGALLTIYRRWEGPFHGPGPAKLPSSGIQGAHVVALGTPYAQLP